MDADEKLAELTKACTEMIMNISTESAARAMESDRKSARYQHEIQVTKEEAARMLVRLKEMMDSKTREAEAASFSQRKKIEELEAQLQEAGDIVKDLREELAQVHAERERAKNEESQHVNENVGYSVQSQNESSLACDVTTPDLSHGNGCAKCFNKIVCTCGGAYIGKLNLPSIILRSKKVGPFRNGWTQRIRACERNLSDRELCLSKEKGKETSESQTFVSEPLNELEKKLPPSGSQSFQLKKKRANRRRKTAIPLGPVLLLDKFESQTQTGFSQFCEEEGDVEETVLAESLLSLDCKVDVEKMGAPSSIIFDAKTDELLKRLPSQRVNAAPVKFTYQRRRLKKQPLSGSNDMNVSAEKETKTGDELKCDQKLVESTTSSSMGSTRESRRMAQVARQLLSLSEKKYWN